MIIITKSLRLYGILICCAYICLWLKQLCAWKKLSAFENTRLYWKLLKHEKLITFVAWYAYAQNECISVVLKNKSCSFPDGWLFPCVLMNFNKVERSIWFFNTLYDIENLSFKMRIMYDRDLLTLNSTLIILRSIKLTKWLWRRQWWLQSAYVCTKNLIQQLE